MAYSKTCLFGLGIMETSACHAEELKHTMHVSDCNLQVATLVVRMHGAMHYHQECSNHPGLMLDSVQHTLMSRLLHRCGIQQFVPLHQTCHQAVLLCPTTAGSE